MTQRSATIKVLCRTEALQDTANMLQWAIGHRVEIAENTPNTSVGHLFIFTDIEYYGNDATLFENFGFDIIGKIRGVVSWEILEPDQEDNTTAPAGMTSEEGKRQQLEVELMRRLCTLPITISIMPRMGGKFAWKCLEASGHTESFAEALDAALVHLTQVFKLMRSELLG